MVFKRFEKSSGGDVGKNCARVIMARLRTAGRAWERSGEMTTIGGGDIDGLDKWIGKRVIRIDRTERVSMSTSGGLEDCHIVSTNLQLAD